LEFLHLNNFNLSISLEELQQYGDQLLNHCLREDEFKRQAEVEPSSISKLSPTIPPQTKTIEEAPPDSRVSSDTYSIEKKRSSKSKSSLSSPNEIDANARPRITSSNSDTSPKWANGRYINSMRSPLNVDTSPSYRHSNSNNDGDTKTPHHSMSDPKFQSTPTFSASRKLDALLDASLTSTDRKSAADIDHYLPTPPNSVSPQFQSHQTSLADPASK
jgi:hypothetical protein